MRKIPDPKFEYRDIVLAPRWRIGGNHRRFVIAEVVKRWYTSADDGYDPGWRYKVKRGRKVWDELYEPRLRLLYRDKGETSEV